MDAKTKDKMINLQHDAHNLLDRLDNQLRLLDNWNRENYSNFCKEVGKKPKDSSRTYVVAEYLRTHVKEMREITNEFYNLTKNEN